MKGNRYIIFLILIPFIMSFHNLLNDFPIYIVDLFLFCDKSQDIQWYVKDTCDLIGLSLVFYVLKGTTNDKRINTVSNVLFIYFVVSIAGYWLFYLQHDIIIITTTLLISTIIESRDKIRKNNEPNSNTN